MAGETTTENQFTQRVNTQHYFVSPIGMFRGYRPAKPCITARFNNSRVLCIISNTIIPNDMRFEGFEIWSLSRPNSLLGQWDSGGVWCGSLGTDIMPKWNKSTFLHISRRQLCRLLTNIQHTGVRSLLVSYGDSNVWPGGLLQATVLDRYHSMVIVFLFIV